MSTSCNDIFRYALLALGLLLSTGAWADEPAAVEQSAVDTQLQETLKTLNSLLALQADLRRDIQALGRQLKTAQTEGEKADLRQKMEKLDSDLQTTSNNLKQIAAGADIASLRVGEEKKFNFQEELFSLIRPALKEMKDMTSHVRQKSDLKDRIAYYKDKLPVTKKAVDSIGRLLERTEEPSLKKALQGMLDDWQKQLAFMQSELQSAELQLDKIESSETSIAQASQSYIKGFFQKRGLYLTQALLVVLGVLLLSRLAYEAMVRIIPGYQKEHRSFHIRLLDLAHRAFTVLLAIIGPMLVFYLVEDWVLFSLGILLLLGIVWTVRQALPRYWHQVQLFLNVGGVREGERLFLDGLPWRVRQINIYSTLENPTAGLAQRVPIDDLVDLKSRPCRPDEPWFPCRRDDWVILADGQRGKVTGISQELVQMVERGGAHRTYQTPDFLGLSPRNIAVSFRLKEIIGISYDLQHESVTSIPDLLKAHVEQRIADEGYGQQLLNLRVEFQQANTSSLDLVVIADFDGAVADLYNRLRRAIQRWCVEACTQHGWEIPFQQVTLHRAGGGD